MDNSIEAELSLYSNLSDADVANTIAKLEAELAEAEGKSSRALWWCPWKYIE